MTDPLGDFLTRIRNSYLANGTEVRAPYSKLKEAVTRLMITEGYVTDLKVEGEGVTKELVVELKYINASPALTNIKRMSKPGFRRYTTKDTMPRILGGYGLTIISTSQGLMTDKQAKAKGLGGELLCSIW